jgi:hypothetical protein
MHGASDIRKGELAVGIEFKNGSEPYYCGRLSSPS